MNVDQAKEVVRFILATWRVEMTDDQAAVWMDTLADVAPAHAREALRDLKRVKTFVPGHADFFEAVEAVAHREAARDEERMLGEPGGAKCPNDCTGGWVELDRVGQGHVERCDYCHPPEDPKVEHKAGCSCSRCYYGPKRLAIIRAGRDGMPARRDPSFDEELNKARFAALRDDMAKVGTRDRVRPAPSFDPAAVVTAAAAKLRVDADTITDEPPPPAEPPPYDDNEEF